MAMIAAYQHLIAIVASPAISDRLALHADDEADA